jgi:hypothetical protein
MLGALFLLVSLVTKVHSAWAYPTNDYYFYFNGGNVTNLKFSIPKTFDREELCPGCKMLYDRIIEFDPTNGYPYYVSAYLYVTTSQDFRMNETFAMACFTVTNINKVEAGQRGFLVNILSLNGWDQNANAANVTFLEAIKLYNDIDGNPTDWKVDNSSLGWEKGYSAGVYFNIGGGNHYIIGVL